MHAMLVASAHVSYIYVLFTHIHHVGGHGSFEVADV